MKALHVTAFILVIIGGLNWLAFALFNGAEIGSILGGMDSLVSKIVYILVGLSAIYLIFTHKKACKDCMVGGSSGMPSGM